MREKLFNITATQGYKNMPDFIAESLKEAILHGKFKGGVPLKQDEIAKQFNASLIPVREALIQLEAKGLVKSIRNKGAIVTNLNVLDMQQLFQVRKILETGIVNTLPDNLNQEKLEKMKFLLGKMKNEKDIFTLTRHNRLFHELLCDMAGNVQITQIYQNLFVKVERYLIYMYHLIPDTSCGREDHTKIVALLETGEFSKIIKYITSHIDDSEKLFLEFLERNYDIEALDWNIFIPFD